MRRLLVLVATLVWLLAGCAPATRVILLPDGPDAKPTAVVVSTDRGSQTIDKPYQSATVNAQGQVDSEQLRARDVRQRYPQLLAAQPPVSRSFTLYFKPGTSELADESAAQLATVLEQATVRDGGEVVITGHTDRVGTVESNDALSLRRAAAIRELVVKRGFDPTRVYAIGRGEREPVVPTADEVDEPKNRRAEIVVR
jgi:OOP family OmpA-OmpF porin